MAGHDKQYNFIKFESPYISKVISDEIYLLCRYYSLFVIGLKKQLETIKTKTTQVTSLSWHSWENPHSECSKKYTVIDIVPSKQIVHRRPEYFNTMTILLTCHLCSINSLAINLFPLTSWTLWRCFMYLMPKNS